MAMKHPTNRAERREVDRFNSGDDFAKTWRNRINRIHRTAWGWVHDRARRDYIAGLRRAK